MTDPPNQEVRVRDFHWLDELANAKFEDPARDILLAKLARSAALQFCQQPPPRHSHSEDPAHAEATLPPLLRVLLISAEDQSLEKVIGFVTAQPERFSLEKVQVPSLHRTIAWRRKQKIAVHPRILAWLRSLRQQLSTATAQKPQPPAHWARPAKIACACQHCKRLNEILADPHSATDRIHAREDIRSHLISKVHEHQCDVTHKLEETGSPYALVFTKTNGSFDHRMQRYLADQKLLNTVTGLLGE